MAPFDLSVIFFSFFLLFLQITGLSSSGNAVKEMRKEKEGRGAACFFGSVCVKGGGMWWYDRGREGE